MQVANKPLSEAPPTAFELAQSADLEKVNTVARLGFRTHAALHAALAVPTFLQNVI